MKHYRPEEIYLEESVAASSIVRGILNRLPDCPVIEIESTERLLEKARLENPSLPRAKKSLILARHQGRFFKACPGAQTRGETANVCCDYFVINYASNCHMECSYCYLQSYLNFPYLIIYANSDDLLAELDSALGARPEQFFRIGTGELADSLALDPLTAYSEVLVRFFSTRRNAVLELKTKSDCIDRLLKLDHRGRTVVSWSINPRSVQRREEHKTASISWRLEAARLCAEAGYPIAFHLDPIVYFEGWEKEYRELVAEIFASVPPGSVLWVSMGALRMTRRLKELMRRRFPNSFLPLGELVPSADGKLRYIKPIRTRMYQKIGAWIRRQAPPSTALYACMERPEVWSRAFGRTPPSNSEIGNSLVTLLT